MTGTEFISNLDLAAIPGEENRMSRRYLKILTRWIPHGVRYFSEWPGRPNCGHFFGGCHWYGNETVGPAEAFAVVSTSPEYDEDETGVSREDLRNMAIKGIRYLCFTHDTGPEDCVRPSRGMGRSETWGNKWGERGRGFFPESQCGHGIAGLARVCTLLREWVDEETLGMVARIQEDYAERFGDMPPRGGIYADTQMEENAWTSAGLTSCYLFLQNHPRASEWEEKTRRWMFSTCSAPQDAKNLGKMDGDVAIRSLAGKTFTALPDYWAENHGFVHPSYTASGVWSIIQVGIQLGMWGRELPGELLWNRRRIYENLKWMADGAGHAAAVQGMDWAYLPAVGFEASHAVASVIFRDGDAAALQLRGLRTAELRQEGNGGRLYDEDFAMRAHDQQDPMIMREITIRTPAWLYLFHRIFGPGAEPTPAKDLEARLMGVRVNPHAGFVHHRHTRGQTSFSWRNSAMVLPLPREGIYTISPCSDSWLGRPRVRERQDSQELKGLRVTEYAQGFAATMIMDRCQGSLRQRVLVASSPDGRLLSQENFVAMDEISLESLDQGFLRVTNETFPLLGDNCRGRRNIYTPGGEMEFEGWLGEREEDDELVGIGEGCWINIDDRTGIRYRGTGSSTYLNRHFFKPYRAIADDLVLSHREGGRYGKGDEVGSLGAVVVPGQAHGETSSLELDISTEHDSACMLVDGLLAAANFSPAESRFAFEMPRREHVQLFEGSSTNVDDSNLVYEVLLGPREAILLSNPIIVSTEGKVRFDSHQTGPVHATCTESEGAVVTPVGGKTIRVPGGKTVKI